MKLAAPLRTPAQNTEQRIFKFVLFVVLPLKAILTVCSYITINAKKNDVAEERTRIKGVNANKRMMFFLIQYTVTFDTCEPAATPKHRLILKTQMKFAIS